MWNDPETTTNTITYKYDLAGKVLETSDNTGTIKNTYDTAGRLIQVDYPNNRVVSYEYDAAGNRTKLTYPDNSYITYEYDQLNRLTKIRDQASTVLAQYTYDPRSRRTNLSYANGTSIGYQYDAASRLLDVNNVTDTGNYKYAYTYDKVGNRLTMLVNDTEQHTYGYDDIYQVTDVNYPDSYAYLVEDTTFNYDDASNRTSVIDGGTVDYVSDELNQYDSVGGVYYDYDQNGNLTYDATWEKAMLSMRVTHAPAIVQIFIPTSLPCREPSVFRLASPLVHAGEGIIVSGLNDTEICSCVGTQVAIIVVVGS